MICVSNFSLYSFISESIYKDIINVKLFNMQKKKVLRILNF